MNRPFLSALGLAGVLTVTVLTAGCGRNDALPEPSSDAYQTVVASFFTGIAAIQVGEDRRAEEDLLRVTRLAPGEAAAWANLGVLALRRNATDLAAERLERARQLAPGNSDIHMLLGIMERNRGRVDEAIEHFRRAVELDGSNLRAAYALLQEIERAGGAGSEDEAVRILDEMLREHPTNLAILLERARIAARRGDSERLQEAIDRIADQSTGWPAEVREQLEALRSAAAGADPEQAATQVIFLQNVLKRVATYREHLAALQPPAEQIGTLLTRFIQLPSPVSTAAPHDDSLSFAPEPLLPSEAVWSIVRLVAFSAEGAPSAVVADGREVRIDDRIVIPFPGGPAGDPPGLFGIAGLDYDYDFVTDLALAGRGGMRLFRQDAGGTFTDVTASTGLSPAVFNDAYNGVWAADVDLEGDIDLILATVDGPPRVLRNNGDGTFQQVQVFQNIRDVRGFAWADLDGDGDPDAVFIDRAGRLRLFANERSGTFRLLEAPAGLRSVLAVDVADLDSDGTFDLVVLDESGSVSRIWLEERAVHSEEVASWTEMSADVVPGAARLLAADLDNNGALDLVASTPSGSRIWLQDTAGTMQLLTSIDEYVLSAADVAGGGRLDLFGLAPDGVPVRLVNSGVKPYHTRTLRPQAALAAGDQRINSFGIGGEIEIRSGLLFQKRPIIEPIVHFGLGDQRTAELARIIWPNGDVQAEFDLESDETVLTRQRLKGSCPWLFTYDGNGMRFITDFIWRSPLGLRINAQETAGVLTTEDWVKIPGDALVPRDGMYDLRITAELWETHFFDHVSLMVVDHPEGSEIFVDERFAFPPPELAVYPTSPPQPIAAARDALGRDVTHLVDALDGRYLGGFVLTPYQGLAESHYVQIELPEEAPVDRPLVLLAQGWIRPTDSSINVAISQGTQAPPTGLSLEVQDEEGTWRTVQAGLGFPAGKTKTILIDLDGLFGGGAVPRVRLRTNLEIYWDAISWAERLPETPIETTRLQPARAELRYRGFSEVGMADRWSPELPEYDRLKGTAQIWQDLTGYYTRFGDVRELLAETDDRYVIMNAGDEMAFNFQAPPPPPAGWARDFVLVGDGWVKDGDYNTRFSRTVLPLPVHGLPDYDTPPGALEDDPVYQRFPQDWQHFHTRYVSAESFRSAMLVRSR